MRYHLTGTMLRRVLPLFLAFLLFAFDGFKLYLKDGSFHVVREYKVLEDRVRYYSIERSEWEEIPTDLVDLKKTESERQSRAEEEKKSAAAEAQEDAFEKELRKEIGMIPPDPGLYLVSSGLVRTFKVAELKVQSNKKRSVLKIITPVPLVAGKSTVEIDGEESSQVISGLRPTFYFRLSQERRFGIVKTQKKKGVRVVAVWNIIPVSNEIISEREDVDIFRQQVGSGLYKIWPSKPLEPGDYAVIEFTEGTNEIQVWDFRVVPPATSEKN